MLTQDAEGVDVRSLRWHALVEQLRRRVCNRAQSRAHLLPGFASDQLPAQACGDSTD